MSEEIEVILFDLGGVLIEFVGLPTVMSWSNDNMTHKEFWEKWLLSPTVRSFESGQMKPEDFAEQIIEEMSFAVSPDKFIEEFVNLPRGLFPGALELLKRISPEYTLAILSNTNALHWSRMMNEMELAELFHHYFASHLIGKLKPDQEVFEHVLEELDCDPGAVLFIEDNLINAEAAKAVGIQSVVVKGVKEAEQALLEFNILS